MSFKNGSPPKLEGVKKQNGSEREIDLPQSYEMDLLESDVIFFFQPNQPNPTWQDIFSLIQSITAMNIYGIKLRGQKKRRSAIPYINR